MIIQTIISQGNNVKGIQVNPIKLKLNAASLNDDSFYWFNAYKTSEFPGLTFDTDYFFLRSTNHDSNNGGIYLGKGNDLALSDYEELGLIFDGHQAETPILYYDSNHIRPIHLYYHTDASDPANGGIQKTHLKTTTGGDLITSTWTQETPPLGTESGDDHLGYLNFWNNGNDLIGIHYKKAVLEPSGFIGEQQYSTYNNDGTWTRGSIVDTTSFTLPNQFAQLSFGIFFKKYNQWWWMGLTRYAPLTNIESRVILCKANSSFQITERIATVYEIGGAPLMRIEDDTMHIYSSINAGISYATFDLEQLQNYL